MNDELRRFAIASGFDHSEEHLERFALYIIHECIKACESVDVGSINRHIERFTIRDCTNAIRERFEIQ